MSNKQQLSIQRTDTIINTKSKQEDKNCEKIVDNVMRDVVQKFGVRLTYSKRLYLSEIIEVLRKNFPNVTFANPLPTSFMTPDGGIVYLLDNNDNKYPLLIAEVKNQGTNDERLRLGLKKQSQGNAVERLGKNVIGLRTYMLTEGIFPFVCFGDGCDFDDGSSILDRVVTIAMFGELNKDNTHNVGPNGCFNRGSYYFRKQNWTEKEMYNILFNVAQKSVYYYFSKYDEDTFHFIRKIK